ncbi:hypothetical protein ACFV4Q_01840 [Streptomyces nojiriensis]|uniref:hypothetical protein n=1 Tax=Streptomyces nojiriensis TaxID=66374 RepID=UPI003667FDFC
MIIRGDGVARTGRAEGAACHRKHRTSGDPHRADQPSAPYCRADRTGGPGAHRLRAGGRRRPRRHTTYAHKGGAPDAGSFDFKLLLHGTDQQRAYFFAPAWGAKFEPCQEVSESELPLAAGKSVTTCEIHLVPDNVQPAFVGFQGDRDNRSPSDETGTAPPQTPGKWTS